jgi:NADH:ubiquinone oxidoreductase subunit 2 (subunit N)
MPLNLHNYIAGLYLSVYLYVFLISIFIMYIYTVNFYLKLHSSVKFNLLDNTFNFKINFILLLASLLGIPPLMGFFSKLIILINLIFFEKHLIIIVFLALNLFLLIFYLQQFKFLFTNKKKYYFMRSTKKFSYNMTLLILIFQFFNVFSLIFLPILFEWFVFTSL